MPILFKGKAGDLKMSPSKFSEEWELKGILINNPELLLIDGEPPVKLVGSEIEAPDAGRVDLLLVNSEGLPMTVNVRMGGGDYSGIITSALKNAASLSQFSARELDAELNGTLGGALESFYSNLNDYFAIERRWKACDTFLLEEQIRLIFAVDEASDDLIRLVRFIDSNSDFDLRLVVIKKYVIKDDEDVLIPEIVVSGEGVFEHPRVRFMAAVDAYSIVAPKGFKLAGKEPDWKEIRPAGWGGSAYYGLKDGGAEQISAGVYLANDAGGLSETLSGLEAEIAVAVKWGNTLWDQNWEGGAGKLEITFDRSTSSMGVAKALKMLVEMTKEKIEAALK